MEQGSSDGNICSGAELVLQATIQPGFTCSGSLMDESLGRALTGWSGPQGRRNSPWRSWTRWGCCKDSLKDDNLFLDLVTGSWR